MYIKYTDSLNYKVEVAKWQLFLYNEIGDNMSVIDDKINSLAMSKFRGSFHLRKYMIDYINKKGLEQIEKDAYYFIETRLSDTSKVKDGAQTPMKGHPVFLAQHATATCCRSCFNKWYHIPKDRILTSHEIDFAVALIMAWIKKELKSNKFIKKT